MALSGYARRREVLDRQERGWRKYQLGQERDGLRLATAEAMRITDPIERHLTVAALTERYRSSVAEWQAASARAVAHRRELERSP